MIKQFGTNYAGFFYPENLDKLNSESVIYCVGAGEDISHDLLLQGRTGANIHIFDPTPRAISHFEMVKQVLQKKIIPTNSKRYGGGDPEYWKIIQNSGANSEKLFFYDFGLHIEDISNVKFFFPKNPDFVSCSAVEGMKGTDFMTVQMKSLQTIMFELSHTKIDLLKIDIEGLECEVIQKMLHDKIFPKYLSVDFDSMELNKMKCLHTIHLLKKHNYSILNFKGNDFSFIHNS